MSIRARNLSTYMDMAIDTVSGYTSPLHSRWQLRFFRTTTIERSPGRTVYPRLPLELQNAIITECNVRSSLLSCSLVCYTWVPLSRRKIVITVNSHQDAAKFGRLLRSPRQTLSLVRHLILRTNCPQGEDNIAQHRRILRRLLSLKGADIHSVVLDASCGSMAPLLEYYPRITSLGHSFTSQARLNSPAAANLDFDKFILSTHSFLRVRCLCLNVEWPTRYNPPTPPVPPDQNLMAISSLRIVGRWRSWNIYLLARFGAIFQSLEYLELEMDEVGTGIEGLTKILRTNRRTLSQIALTFHPTHVPFDLSPLKKLKSIRLTIFGALATDVATRSLLTLNGSCVEEVVLILHSVPLSTLVMVNELVSEHLGLVCIIQTPSSVMYGRRIW